MKKTLNLLSTAIVLILLTTSCGGGNSSSTKDNAKPAVSADSSTNPKSETKVATNCNQFLKDYESFADKYIAILKKYKANPTDASILSDYSKLSTEATEWSTKTADCSADPAFAAKFTKIAQKITNAVAGL